MSLQQAKRENRFLFSFWRFELNIIDSMVVPICTNQACEISVVSNLVVKKQKKLHHSQHFFAESNVCLSLPVTVATGSNKGQSKKKHRILKSKWHVPESNPLL